MNAALEQGEGITVAINADSLYSSRAIWQSSSSNPDFTTYDHQIQVIRVDLASGKVWVNDSALKTGGQEFSLSGLMKSWQASDYDLTVVSAIAHPAAWRTRSRPDPEFGAPFAAPVTLPIGFARGP